MHEKIVNFNSTQDITRAQFDNIIDFHSASHGHFLEYVINCWIYNGHRIDQPLTDLGTATSILSNARYQDSRMIHCNHFTQRLYPPINRPRLKMRPKKIVRINVSTTAGKWILMINSMYRIGDISLPGSYKVIPDHILSSPAKLRMDWFSKFVDDENRYDPDHPWEWSDITAFDFPMESIFDLSTFYHTLSECAVYLEQKFRPDHELYTVWKKFMLMNQGVQIYNKSKQIADLVLGQENHEFDSIEPEQALINVLLSRAVGIHDGPMFTDDIYATNTTEIWKLVKEHLDNFDNRF